jgi:hypothetical protein
MQIQKYVVAAVLLLAVVPCFAAGSISGYVTDYHNDGMYESEIFSCKSGTSSNTAYYRCETSGYYNLGDLSAGTYSIGLNDPFHCMPRLRSFVPVQDNVTTPGNIKIRSTYYVRGSYLNAGTAVCSEIRQTFVATGDVVKITLWMPTNLDLNVSIHDASNGNQIGPTRVTNQMDRDTVKWLHGEVPLTPGNTYYVRITRAGGGTFQLYCNTNQNGNLYPYGQAYYDGQAQPTVDIGMVIESDDAGLATMYQRPTLSTGEWASEIGQTFKALGSYINIVTVYATATESSGTDVSFSIHQNGPGGTQIGPTKTVRIRDYRPMGQLVAVTWQPGEVQVSPGQTYYLKMSSSSGFYVFCNTSNPYSDGCMYVAGSARSNSDIVATIMGETSLNSSLGTLSGTITDENQTVIPGATIKLSPFNYSTSSNANGQYNVQATADQYTVTVSKPYYDTRTFNVTLDPGETEVLNVTLPYTGSLVQNSGFESGFTDGVGNYWTKFVLVNNPQFLDETSWKRSGSHAQRWWTSWYTHDAGIRQTVAVNSGTSYTLTAWTFRLNPWNDGSEVTRIGIDPYGGTDPTSANVVWSSTANASNTWVQQSVTTTAQSSTITVFIRGTASAAGEYMVACVDDVVLAPSSPTGTITGFVKDTSNNPISGATVQTNSGGYSTTTQADGSYTLSNVAVGTYNVTASKSGYQSQTISNVSVSSGQTVTCNFNLTPLTGTISGYVKNSAGEGIGGATVSTNPGGYSTVTQSDGSYTLANVVVGTYSVTASKTRCTSQTQSNVTVNTNQTTTVNFTINGTGDTIGALANACFQNSWTYREGGVPSPPGGWFLAGWAATSGGPQYYTDYELYNGRQSDHRCKWEFNGGGVGGNNVIAKEVNWDGYQSVTVTVWCAGRTWGSTNGDMKLGIDADGCGTQWSDCGSNTASRTSNDTTWAQLTKTVSKPAGAATFTVMLNAVPAGTTWNCQFDKLEIVGSGPTGTISGYVKDNNNNPISGATVQTNTGGYSTTSGPDGSYTLSDVAVGTYNVTASKSGYQSQTQNNVSVSANQTTTVNFSLTPTTGTISGYVRNAAGVGIAGATVQTNTGGYSTTTQSDGSYTLSNVAPGTYNVTASKTGWLSQTNNGVSVSAGQTTTSNFTLRVAIENFESMPSWSSSYDASWGSAATWSIVSGGQSGNYLQASRSSQGSSAKVKVYTVPTNTNVTISVYMKCPSYSGTYWVESAYRLGSYSAENFDTDSGNWTMIKKFSDSGTNGNGNVWTQYSVSVNTGSNTQISIGYKHGAYGCAGPIVGWDTFRIE